MKHLRKTFIILLSSGLMLGAASCSSTEPKLSDYQTYLYQMSMINSGAEAEYLAAKTTLQNLINDSTTILENTATIGDGTIQSALKNVTDSSETFLNNTNPETLTETIETTTQINQTISKIRTIKTSLSELQSTAEKEREKILNEKAEASSTEAEIESRIAELESQINDGILTQQQREQAKKELEEQLKQKNSANNKETEQQNSSSNSNQNTTTTRPEVTTPNTEIKLNVANCTNCLSTGSIGLTVEESMRIVSVGSNPISVGTIITVTGSLNGTYTITSTSSSKPTSSTETEVIFHYKQGTTEIWGVGEPRS